MANKKVQKAGKAAQTARSNPYVQRLIEDEDLRKNIVAGLRVGPRRLCAAEQRQEPDEADLRRQEAAEAHQGDRGQRARRERRAARGAQEAEERRRLRPRPAARHRRRRGRAGACPRGCARRCSTRCSAPRRSSSTPRRPRRHPRRRHGRRRRPWPIWFERAPTGRPLSYRGWHGPWTSTGSASAGTCSAGPPIATRRSPCSTPTSRPAATSSTPPTRYMRPNMGNSETIIGEWMAARGNRDQLVIATKVGSDGGLSAAEHRRARRRRRWSACRPTGSTSTTRTRTTARVPVEETVRAFDQTVRDGKVLQVAASNVPPERLRESLELAEREGLAPYSGCSRTTTSSSARATSATTRRSWRATGCRSRRTTRSPSAS